MIINEGELVGQCPEHGFVIKDALDLDFPNSAYCGVCGEELDEVVVLDEAKVIHENEVIDDPENVSDQEQ